VLQLRHDDSNVSVLSKWEGNGEVKISPDILCRAGFVSGDSLSFKIENESIVISKAGTPKEGTIEHLFEGYEGGPFQTSLVELGDPVGEEKW
jgi:antitoxin component of MazEF toxin-antitoxin module